MCRRLSFLVFVVFGIGLLGPGQGDAAGADPGLTVWYKLDESAGLNANDSSMYNRDGTLYQWPEDAGFTPGWDPDGGHFGGCLIFNDDTRITVPKSALSTVTNGITVSLWLKDAWRVGMNCVFDAGVGQEELEEFRVMAFIGTAPDAEVLWRAGNDSNDTLRWDLDGGSVVDLEGWHLWTFVKDEVAGNMQIYFDGYLVESKGAVANTLLTVLPTKLPESGFDFRIGSRNKQYNDLEGTLDEFVVYDRALSDEEVERLYYTGGDMDRGIAWKPSPAHRGQNLCPDVALSWSPGDYAQDVNGHNVYFGTDFDNVNNATDPCTPPGRGRQNLDANSYAPVGLELGKTYYWRIDEVNDPCLWKGDVWQFTINDGNAFDPDPADGQTAVPVGSVLSWSAGCDAASHDVYFGTDFDNVNTGTGTFQGNQDLADTDFDPHDWDPCGLDYETTYYWRIEEVNGMTTWKGQVWSFSSGIAVTDPNFLLWYRLDESEGYEARDSSNYLRHAVVRIRDYLLYGGVPDWTPDEGRWGGSLGFDDDTAIWVPTTTLSKLSDAITIVVWIQNGNNWAFQANGGDFQLAVQFGSGVTWRAGNDTNDVLTMGGGRPSGWNHYAFIKDETEGNIQIYFNGELAESDDVVDNTLIGVRSKPFKIGGRTQDPADFRDGRMDEFMVYDRALSEGEVARQYETGGPVGEAVNAWMPTPRNDAIDVPRDVVLTWKKGDYAQDVNGHDVYFGTSWNDVNDANTTETLGVYKGSQDVDANSYTPGILELDTTYYWRIDEVNETDEVNSPWKGPVWRFRVANFLVVDDMEDYNDIPPDRLLDTWHDWSHYDPVGGQFPTSAEITLETADANVHGSRQSMKFQYNNTDVGGWMFYRNISEIDANTIGPLMHLEIGQDWTILDRKVLTLHFIGLPDNDATEQMYVALADSAGHTAVVPYGYYIDEDMNDIKKREWQEWNIALEDFNDINNVDVTDVNNVYIGFGNRDNPVVGGSGVVFFDDIRLHPAKCIPAREKLVSDLSNNCIVGLEDIEIMADHWLRTDANFLPVQNPGTTGLVAWWKLDGNAFDSHGTNHGTVGGSYSWVTGHIGTGALEFTGSGGRVLVPDATALRPTHTVSVSAWVNFSEPQNASRVVVKGKNDAETYEIEVDGYDSFIFLFRDFDNTTKYDVGGPLWPDEWFHLAGTYDGLTIKCYLNGRLVDSKEESGIALSQDTTGLAIGNKSDATDTPFRGTIDDVRVYNRGLSADEVEYLATDGTGYAPLTSPANIYDEEEPGYKAVNLRDYAVMVDKWLEEKLWPPE